jgi:hypothetical protein
LLAGLLVVAWTAWSCWLGCLELPVLLGYIELGWVPDCRTDIGRILHILLPYRARLLDMPLPL